MESQNLLKEKASFKPYECPRTEVLFVDVQRVICASGDNNGEMNNGGFLDE